MHLGEMLVNFINQNNISAKSVNSTENMQMPSNSSVTAQIKALAPGQILQGEVLDSTGDTVKLSVNMNGESIPLQARMEQSVLLSVGKSLLFQVKNNGTTLSLSPLFENMGMEQNAAKALETASLPVNTTTMEMTAKLMQEGVSIDKNTLQQIYHETVQNSQAELADIIDLHKLNLPVTGENLEQLHAYKGMNHQLTGAVEQMSQDMLQLVQNMAENGQETTVEPFLRAVLQFDGEVGTTIPIPENINQKQIVQELLQPETISNELLKEQVPQSATIIVKEDVTAQEIVGQENIVVENDELDTGLDETLLLKKETIQNMTPKQLLETIFVQLKSVSTDKKSLSKLLRSKSFKEELEEVLQKELLLQPELADKEQVQEMYNRLETNLGNMTEVLEIFGQKQSPLANTVQNMSQNLNFLQQMNQMYAYIQLPLKLSEGNAHSELYVYSNKKHLASNDGEVSALLHLDMDHLGPVDVHVAMKDTTVNTQFFVKDDAMLDFLYERMGLLTARLEKRGYHMNCRMIVKGDLEGSGSVNGTMKALLQENSNIPTMVNYSFDVRA